MGIFGGLFGRKPYMGAQIREDANAPKLTDLLGQSTGETQQPWNTQPQALPQKPGLFGQGGKGWDVIGGTADALLQMRGAQPIYDDGSKRRLQEAILQAQIQQQTHQANRQFDVQNPMPSGPNDTERDYQFILEKDGPEAAQQWLKNRYDPIVNIPLPDGVYLGPRSQLPSTVGGAPVKTQPKGQLRPYGGPMPSASGGFR